MKNKQTFTSAPVGPKVELVRRLRGIKQETVANALGISRQAFAKLEKASEIEEGKLGIIADALDVTTDMIKNFNEQAIFHNTSNTFQDSATLINYNAVSDKMIELYEELLKSEREKIEILKKHVEQLSK